jgi:DNA ligase-1
MTTQPPVTISKGKVKRTITEQTELEYNSLIKKYKDKGYKDISEFGFNSLNDFDPIEVFPKDVVDTNNVKKPMLAKVLDKTNKKLTDRKWLASNKLDGLRTLLYYRDGEVHTASRGGQDYDIAATYIRLDPFVNQLFEANPNLMLDGELYNHHPDYNLQKISGLGRLETLHEDHKNLKFYCYDIVDETKPFKDRLTILMDIQSKCPSDSKLIVINHDEVEGLDNIMNLHNERVSLGYEGLVLRDPDQLYKCKARDNRMVKVKEFNEDSFIITGYELGLRGIEDMCFVLKTKENNIFKAKPIGDRSVKEDYIKNIEDIIGRKGDVKYFNITPDGIPNLPVFLAVRYDI